MNDYYKESRIGDYVFFAMMTAIVVIILGTFIFVIRSAYLNDVENAENERVCEDQCAPYAYRISDTCECRNSENHWVPQGDF